MSGKLTVIVVLSLALALANADCGKSGRARGDGWRIIHGDMAESDRFPWTVHLRVIGQGGYGTCGGALIAKDTVLTAAHCIPPKQQIKGIIVTAGETRPRDATRKDQYLAVSVRPHKDYFHALTGDDIMILKLDRPVENVTPICLPEENEDISEGTKCYVAGWGTTETGPSSHYLKYVDVLVTGNKSCNRIRGNNILDSQICAGGNAGKNGCKGDSGGPLMCESQRKDGRFVISGIVSYGDSQCGIPGRPSVFTRVASHLDWIKEHSN